MDDATIRSLKGDSLTIGELLNIWGYRVRDDESVPTIIRDLRRVGLATEPSFARGPKSAKVTVVAIPASGPSTADERTGEAASSPGVTGVGAAPSSSDAGQEDGADADQATTGVLPHVSMQVGHLAAACGGVESVTLDTTLHKAVATMAHYDYSQLPVMTGEFKVHGVVSWRSIAGMHAAGSRSSLAAAMSSDVDTVHTTDDLLAVLPKVTSKDFVVVRDSGTAKVCGIVTTADIALQFESVAKPFFTVGEIERRLRKCLKNAFDATDVKAVYKKAESVDDLMFGQYITLLEKPERWKKLGWRLDREIFVEGLDRVRKVRNEIMHFRPTPLTHSQRQDLDRFNGMLKLVDPH